MLKYSRALFAASVLSPYSRQRRPRHVAVLEMVIKQGSAVSLADLSKELGFRYSKEMRCYRDICDTYVKMHLFLDSDAYRWDPTVSEQLARLAYVASQKMSASSSSEEEYRAFCAKLWSVDSLDVAIYLLKGQRLLKELVDPYNAGARRDLVKLWTAAGLVKVKQQETGRRGSDLVEFTEASYINLARMLAEAKETIDRLTADSISSEE